MSSRAPGLALGAVRRNDPPPKHGTIIGFYSTPAWVEHPESSNDIKTGQDEDVGTLYCVRHFAQP